MACPKKKTTDLENIAHPPDKCSASSNPEDPNTSKSQFKHPFELSFIACLLSVEKLNARKMAVKLSRRTNNTTQKGGSEERRSKKKSSTFSSDLAGLEISTPSLTTVALAPRSKSGNWATPPAVTGPASYFWDRNFFPTSEAVNFVNNIE